MILLEKLKSIYKLLLISILATFTVASSANSTASPSYSDRYVYNSSSTSSIDGCVRERDMIVECNYPNRARVSLVSCKDA